MRTGYDTYLKSEHWEELKRQYKKDRCLLCGSPDYLHLHHTTYRRKGRERPHDLCTLCRGCHKLIHSGTSKKRQTKPNPQLNVIFKCLDSRKELTQRRANNWFRIVCKINNVKKVEVDKDILLANFQKLGHLNIRKYLPPPATGRT